MKFGKEFVSQMVPEWQEAYMDYNFLKSLLKEIHLSKQRDKPAGPKPTVRRNPTLYRAFSGLTQRGPHSPRGQAAPDLESQAILVQHVRDDGEERSETMFMMATDEGGEKEMVYFKKLDDEFNKVSKFYKVKVEEVMKEAAMLNKQMEALIAFRVKVENPKGWSNSVEETNQLASDVAASRAAMFASTPSAVRASKGVPIAEDSSVRKGENAEMKAKQHEKKAKKAAPLEILERVTFNTSDDSPRSTIKRFLNISNQTDLKFTEDNLKKAEDQLKKALVEFYSKLRLLKSYSFLNIMAFAKIMKKYDKITIRHASRSYMKMVDRSYLGSSDEVSKLMERVEVTFIKHFSNSNRRKGMNILRPKRKQDKHAVTFSMGFLFGCTFALIIALILIIRARDIIGKAGRLIYMETMFPLYSFFGFVVLHMVMYAGNIYYWRRYRVNYAFIFGFKAGTELGYREVLLMGSSLSVLALVSVLANLDMEMDPVTKDYEALTELLPLGLLLLVIAIMLCPLNILYRSSRFFLLSCIFRCLLAPLYKVTLPDFFLADQLTSQVQALRSLEFYICYYAWGDYKLRQNKCSSNSVFNTFSFIVAAVPYWSRLLQCLRRLYDEGDIHHGYNGLKYLSTIFAVSARTAYTLNQGNSWLIAAWVTSINATIFSTYWDIVVDWGLFNRRSRNRWLRDKLLLPYKSAYFVAIGFNVLLRLAWMQTVLNIKIFSLHKQTMVAIVSALEIIRRGVWSFFRLENEHLNNVGKYRAFKSVPLPFNYDEDEDVGHLHPS